MLDDKILMDILDARERRAKKQAGLIGEYHSSLISFTLNIPGRVKDKVLYRDIHREGMNIIEDTLKIEGIRILYKEVRQGSTGSEGYIVVDKDSYALKEIAINIEETHPLGRIFDIDIFSNKNEQVSRSDIDSIGRKCLLCDNDARVCMRMRNHTYEDLIGIIDKTWLEYTNKKWN